MSGGEYYWLGSVLPLDAAARQKSKSSDLKGLTNKFENIVENGDQSHSAIGEALADYQTVATTEWRDPLGREMTKNERTGNYSIFNEIDSQRYERRYRNNEDNAFYGYMKNSDKKITKDDVISQFVKDQDGWTYTNKEDFNDKKYPLTDIKGDPKAKAALEAGKQLVGVYDSNKDNALDKYEMEQYYKDISNPNSVLADLHPVSIADSIKVFDTGSARKDESGGRKSPDGKLDASEIGAAVYLADGVMGLDKNGDIQTKYLKNGNIKNVEADAANTVIDTLVKQGNIAEYQVKLRLVADQMKDLDKGK